MKRKTYVKCEPKYIVKKEEGMVICVLNCYVDLISNPYFMMFEYGKHRKLLPNISRDGRFTITSIAKCHKDDTFDEIKGKRIAESKAKIKAFNIAGKVYKFYADAIEKASKELYSTMANCFIVTDEEIEHFNNLTK